MTYAELIDRIHEFLPGATVGEDFEGQLIVYTGLAKDGECTVSIDTFGTCDCGNRYVRGSDDHCDHCGACWDCDECGRGYDFGVCPRCLFPYAQPEAICDCESRGASTGHTAVEHE